jgi:hypothetical protein
MLLRDGGEYTISKEQVLCWSKLYPNTNTEKELEHLKELWINNDIPRKTAKNINKFINKWLSKQEESNKSI